MPLSRQNSCIDVDFTLRRVFKKRSFRPLQREVVIAALDGHDVFLQAATSFGKSICFQLPAVVDHGITIVISPLLSLMNNQIDALTAAGIKAASINSGVTYSEKQRIFADLATGHPLTRLLYVTPEFCGMDHFQKHIRRVHEQRELARIAIDEAHCISEWGHDFRKSFKDLNWFRENFPDVPIICLTATATLRVRQDVIKTLGLVEGNMKVFTMSTSRENLHYEVRFTNDEEDHFDDFLFWLKRIHQRRSEADRLAELQAAKERPEGVSGIIYTLFRKDCELLAARLRSSKIGAKPYHAGLSQEVRYQNLVNWVNNVPGYEIIVATTAFGMGIDKENVRFVIHWQMPKSFEGYYQEAGRAGRDGKASACIMYYSREDRDRALYRLASDCREKNTNFESRNKSLQALIGYCEGTEMCRHEMITRYFGEMEKPVCKWACDGCKDRVLLKRRKKNGLKSEEWVSTQRENGNFDMEGYEGYD